MSTVSRAAAGAHRELQHGLSTLATIACLAPFVGILGTLQAISFDTFFGIGTEKSTAMAAIAEGLSRACVPAALGLLVGLQSFWCYRYCCNRLSEFDRELQWHALAWSDWLRSAGVTPQGRLSFMEGYGREANATRGAVMAACGLVAAGWCAVAIRLWYYDSMPIAKVVRSAACHVVVAAALSYLGAHAIWVDLLHRQPRGRLLFAAALCICWCAANFLFPLFG